jgi:hypothetical protein
VALIFTTKRVRFEEVCTVEDALPLLEFFKSIDTPEIDLSTCTWLHTALLQLLLTACPRMVASPADPALARWVAPLLANGGSGADG